MPIPKNELIDFSNRCPTQYHLIDECVRMLQEKGFQELRLSETWNLENGKSYFLRKIGGLYAFSIGNQYVPGNGVALACGQIDSPGLVVKPMNDRPSDTYSRLAVAVYGSPNLHTWFDRDLTIAGRCFIRRETPETKIETVLIKINMSLIKIPSLAIHFESSMNVALTFDQEENMNPIYAESQQTELTSDTNKENIADDDFSEGNKWSVVGRNGNLIGFLDNGLNFKRNDVKLDLGPNKETNVFNEILAKECNTRVDQIIDYDLNLIDCNSSKSWGANFVSGSRLESIGSTFCLLHGLLDVTNKDHDMIHAIALYEGTENTSQITYGGGSRIVKRIFERIVGCDEALHSAAMSKSCFACVSGAFAANPNYECVHEQNYLPKLNKGPVLNYANRVNFATSSFTAMIANQIASRNSLQLQPFLCKNWEILFPSIGTSVGLTLGMGGFDIGIPMLANGSIREMTTYTAIEQMRQYMTRFFEDYSAVRNMLD